MNDTPKTAPAPNAYSPLYAAASSASALTGTQLSGTPALIWHVVAEARNDADPQNVRPSHNPPAHNASPSRNRYANAVDEYNRRRRVLVDDLNRLLLRLQNYGRVNPELIALTKGGGNQHESPTLVFAQPKPLEFTLWWQDRSAGMALPKEQGVTTDALRVRVRATVQGDHFTLTFAIDVGKPWYSAAILTLENAPGQRRQRIFQNVQAASGLCERNLSLEQSGAEDPNTPIEAELLLEAAKYLYSGVWNELCDDFDFKFTDISGEAGVVLYNSRGLAISVLGRDATTKLSGFNPSSDEPSSMVRAFWPFVPRITPFADYREHIACAFDDWRMLCIAATDAQSFYENGDEGIGRHAEVPSGHLPELHDKTGRTWLRRVGEPPLSEDPLLGPNGEEPLRYLLLTRYEPHEKRVGTVVGRINALETLRILSTKNSTAIAQTDDHIRLRGQELDQVVAGWIAMRQKIEVEFASDRDGERRADALATLSAHVELQLTEIRAGIDDLGSDISGGLDYAIARSRQLGQSYGALRHLLLIGHIANRINYDEFARINVDPVLNIIDGVGSRLAALRERLVDVVGTVQASVLPLQIQEGRRQTNHMRQLLNHFLYNATIVALVFGFFASIIPIKTLAELSAGFCQAPTNPAGQFCRLQLLLLGGDNQSIFAAYLAIAGALILLAISYVITKKLRFFRRLRL